ncbi:Molybdopterin-binding domain of aldehyde dehydrogenase-domain-containing protein [Pyronema domesticum]|uniref:xanthine dehydrogenase n=1 Tax=Pyronema omphalodes (strain CBS 100304) TaxID=1076935 RepID=U4LJ82_PYROM|nr:Molybdopterin-binding domain of aldehyde dehydrogenase-domain-containing protein [Pyronema domesticum]CCX32154.1 Similar to Xanthine dehydrogenase; acc. no. Q12553 [Pyronema omphalodes CBS 100304]
MAPLAVLTAGPAVGPAAGPAVPADDMTNLAVLTSSWDTTLRFYLNGTKVELDQIDPEVTLLEYLRGVGLTGTKLGCAEGGCGACTVVVSQFNPTTQKLYHASVNACLAPLVSVDGKHVITVEGIGRSTKPHPVQERIAKMHGSQCGFCTPGIVMSLYALIRNNPTPTEHDVEEAFDGNLCRCTGYRPILDAAQTFSVTSGAELKSGAQTNGVCCKEGGNPGDAGCCKQQKEVPAGCCKEGKEGAGGCCKEQKEAPPCGKTDGGCCMQNGGDGKRPNGCCMDKQNGDDSVLKKFATPGFIEYRPDTELIFPPGLRKHNFKALALGNKKKRWLRPTTLEQLLQIKAALPSAKVIGGSSETQIEVKFKAMNYSISVYVGDIPDLRGFSFEDNYLSVGGNITLTDLEHVCREAIEKYGTAKAQPFKAILKQLAYFAGRQIRNVGTPAGNLATASPISDLNPVFLATNSVIIAKNLNGEIELPMAEFFKGYRTTALPADAIIAEIRVPVAKETREYIRAYKQAKRKDDDIAIVNAALRVSLDVDSKIESVNLAYGGMAPTTVQAKKTMEYLAGKVWGEPEVLEGAMNALEQDFQLSYSVPGGMATYRKSLALGFFYRFWHETATELKGTATEHDDLVPEIEREISSGSRDHDTAQEYKQKILGHSKEHVSAMKQVTGEAIYTDDIPRAANELVGCLVLSTKAHAKILSVDSSPAMEIPGVVAYVDHNDVASPEANWWGAPSCDEVFFAVDEIFSAGQPIGIILATSAKAAEAGSRAVKVEYEELPAIFTIEEAIEKESYFDHYRYIRRGLPINEAMEKADRVFEGVSRMGGQEHFYLETQACYVIPKLEDGEMEVWSSTQNPTELQSYVAQVTGVQANKIVAKVKRLGGGFGGKETRSVQLAGICAVAAKKLRRPIRCMLNRDEDIATSGARHPFLGTWKIGVNNDGKIVAMDVDIFANAGWTQDLSAAVVDRALSHVDNCYNIPNVDVRGRVCKTNTVSNTAFRGFGGPQGMFICESFMEEIADHMNIPVDELRTINYYHEGDETHYNQKLVDYHVPLMIDQLKAESDFDARRKEVDAFNAAHKWKKRGLSLIPTKFGISFTALFLNQAGALVHIYHDGSVLIAHGGTEMGQGLHTKMMMVAAEALNVPMENVFISETATNTVANTSSTAASASSDLNGYAIFNACAQLNERLEPYRQKFGKDASMKKLAEAAYFDRVNLSANGFYKTPDIGYTWGPNEGMMFFYFTQGVAISEVEIDTLTGDWTSRRTDLKMDIGRSINPAIDYGQIEGAFVQGQGLFTTEEMLWARNNGNIFTKGPGNYKIPGFRDIPQVFNVGFLKGVEWKNLHTIQRSKGVGEPPLFMGSAVFFAIRDALKAARKEHGCQEVLRLVSPATPERIRLSCADDIIKRAEVKPKEGEKGWFIQI